MGKSAKPIEPPVMGPSRMTATLLTKHWLAAAFVARARMQCAGGGASLRAESPPRYRFELSWRRAGGLAMFAVVALAGSSRAQASNITTYYVNDGRSNVYESSGAELQLDLGGFIPFSRYSENNPTGGHAYAIPYDAGSWPGNPATFLGLMKKHGLDLYELDAVLDATVVGLPPTNPPTVLPFGSRVEIDPELLTYNSLPLPDLLFPLELDAWWTCTSGGVAGIGKRKVLMWPYRINGGAMMICMASDGNREIARREPEEASSIVLVNYSFHWRHLGTNKNHWRDAGPGVEWPRQFSDPGSGAFMTQEGGRYSSGQEVLGLQAQAIEDGDVVVFVGREHGVVRARPALVARSSTGRRTRGRAARSCVQAGAARFTSRSVVPSPRSRSCSAPICWRESQPIRRIPARSADMRGFPRLIPRRPGAARSTRGGVVQCRNRPSRAIRSARSRTSAPRLPSADRARASTASTA